MKLKTITKWILLLAIVAGGGYYGYRYFNTEKTEVSYVTEKARRGVIEKTVLANGILQASKLVNVGAQVSGQIKSLNVSLGDNVEEGTLIAQIDSVSQQNQIKEEQAAFDIATAQYQAKEAQIKQAQSEYNRQKKMLATNATSRAEFEAAESTLVVYKAELVQIKLEQEQATIRLDTAKVDLGYTTITAPMTGTVVYTAVEVGQTVNANQTTPTIVEMAQLDTMTVQAEISEADIIHVKPGQEVYFSILGMPNERYSATLRAIEPGPTIMDGEDSDLKVSTSEAIYYNALFDVKNPGGILRIGMTAEVSIILEKADDAVLVPAQTLKTIAGRGGKPRYQVPVLVNGKMEQRDVEVGLNNKVQAQILSGINEGDEIVVGTANGNEAAGQGNRRGPAIRL